LGNLLHCQHTLAANQPFFGLRNPALWSLIRKGHFDAVLCSTGYVRATFWIACVAAKLAGAAFLFGTFEGLQAYQDFILNAYLWLLLGVLFRLPKLALSPQFTSAAAPPSGSRWIR
jgi:hypothetical protein